MNDYTTSKKREYEREFGHYDADEYRSPAQCPEDRRALVAEIKVSETSALLAEHLGRYAKGEFPLPMTEDIEPLYHRIMEWDPHLPRHATSTAQAL